MTVSRWIALGLSGLALGVSRTLPEFAALQVAAIGVHWGICALVGGVALAARWRRGPVLRTLAAGLVFALLHGPVLLMVGLGSAFGDVLVAVDRAGDGYGPEYPAGPKALFRTRDPQGTRELYFRPVYFGFLLGFGRTPYNG